MSNSKVIPLLPAANPPAWLGVMGGGQLGRMFAHAAQSMGYQVAVLEPSDTCPAGQVAQRLVNAGYSDAAGLDALAAQCLAVTTEFENVPADSLSRLAQSVLLRPTPTVYRWRRTALPKNVSLSIARKNRACCQRRTR